MVSYINTYNRNIREEKDINICCKPMCSVCRAMYMYFIGDSGHCFILL